MTGIQPFRGKVVRQQYAHDVVSPAYDALTIPQRQQFRATHPNSYLQVTRSAEDELDAATVDDDALVARGRAALQQIIEQDLFMSHGAPSFYVYRLAEGAHAQHGLVCEVPSEYYGSVARPHEATRPDRAALLAKHFATVKAASSPVACTVRDDGSLDDILVAVAIDEPILDLTSDDGLQQTVWRISDLAVQLDLQERLQDADLFIIDGHHRSAANQQLLSQGVDIPVLVTIFPERSLHLVGFHRFLKLDEGLDPRLLLAEIGRRFVVEAISDVATVEPGHVALFLNDEWHVVQFDERPVGGGASIRLGSLDPVVLEREILTSIVGAHGTVDVTYMPDTEPFSVIAESAATQGRIPIFVPPVAIEDMMAVAEGGLTMPAKSTYFTPKVRSGVFLRLFDELAELPA